MEPDIEKKIHLPAVYDDGFIWIDLQKPSRHDTEIVAKEFGFHELNIEDSLSKNQLPKIDRYQDIPTHNRTVAVSHIPNNLGLVIKSSLLRDFEPLLQTLIAAAPTTNL